MNAKEIVERYWKDMESNDFSKAADNFTNDFICRWPQSNELIRGKDNFIKINSYYPTKGKWEFKIESIIVENNKVVTSVSVTDGEITATVITFHFVEGCLIKEQIEYWPEKYKAPEWRRMWVERIEN